MKTDEFAGVALYLNRLYPGRFATLSPELSAIWVETLAAIPLETVYLAIKRWAAQNQSTWAPNAQALADTAELILADEERKAEQEKRFRARSTEAVNYAAIVDAAAKQQQDPSAMAWARGHATMLAAVLEDPSLTTHDKKYAAYAAWCERFAAQHPQDAEDWHAEAAWWRDGAHGRPSLGTRRVPMMSSARPYTSAYDHDDTDIPF
jgi:hypothetical protein